MYYITVRKGTKDGQETCQGFMVSDQDSARNIYNRFGDWLADLEDNGTLEWYTVGLTYQK